MWRLQDPFSEDLEFWTETSLSFKLKVKNFNSSDRKISVLDYLEHFTSENVNISLWFALGKIWYILQRKIFKAIRIFKMKSWNSTSSKLSPESQEIPTVTSAETAALKNHCSSDGGTSWHSMRFSRSFANKVPLRHVPGIYNLHGTNSEKMCPSIS